jgi:CHASE2 domain-containing sensor protein/tRNA A-37 threonylcarbamoyl transferase component Bud32
MKRIKKPLLVDFLIGLALTVLFFSAYRLSWSPIEKLEYLLYDFGSRLRQAESASPVVIVAIDDQSINGIGRWPWSRSHIARMVQSLSQAGARIIGTDILFSDSDRNQGLTEIRNIISSVEENPPLKKNIEADALYSALKESEKRLDGDALLAASLAESRKVVLPFYFVLGKVAGGATNVPPYLKLNSLAQSGPLQTLTARELIPPIPLFAGDALALGHINTHPDSDGTVRSEPLLINYESRLYPSYALQLTLKYLNYDIKDIRFSEGLKIGNVMIPADEKSGMLIGFNKRFPSYSFVDVANSRIPPSVFKDKIVIIAQSVPGVGTLVSTPIGDHIPAWVVIANVVDNILRRDHVLRPEWAFSFEAGVIGFSGLFLAICLPLLQARIGAAISLALLMIWIGAGQYLLIVNGYWIKTISASLLLFVGYLAIVFRPRFLDWQPNKRVEADDTETNKMLGLSFQGQGMLDMAFEKFKKCPIEDESVRELLYSLGVEFEKKRMFNQALAAYEYIAQSGSYKDVDDRITKFRMIGDTMIFGFGADKKEESPLDDADAKPTLGRYEIVRELGRGAMGAVFLGKDPRINREVAIKTLRYEEIDVEQLEEIKKRFFREAEAAGKLSHPNIITIYDVGEDYDIAYLAMEFLEGTNLTKYCQKDQLLPFPEVVRIVSAVAGALDYAHENGVIHRDIKPANIMILKNGEIRVADFGIARVVTTSKTQTGTILGTPSYMSPEQIAGQKVDGRSDLFSLGVVFYELLTGEKAFQGDSIATLMFSITTSDPVPLKSIAPNLPEHCIAVVDQLLAKDREKRYPQGKDLVRELARYIAPQEKP